MKIAVTGKGGVGKTTVAALLCKALTAHGYAVVAVDADPDANFAAALGFSAETKITPLVEMKELIEERTGAKAGSIGSFFKLNPRVDDLPEKLWHEQDGIKLLQMGTVTQGGSGCICPESTLLKNMVQNMLLYRNEAVVMDMEAGIEHLGRATAQAVDRLIMVAEPGRRSIETAQKITELANDINLNQVSLIANKISNDADREFFDQHAAGFDILGYLQFDEGIRTADMERVPPWQHSPEALAQVTRIAEKLIEK
ncbi:MAG: AAA family ATPase [Deltaproteobacteria bacterium]|nr:AAA family ATPase [Deltaproteobacteria bacterium]